MKTRTSSRSRVIAAWLVLLAFMCCMMVPSSAIAIQEMTIATEGDPGDGMDSTGGGGSGAYEAESEQSLYVEKVEIGFPRTLSPVAINEVPYGWWGGIVEFSPYVFNGELILIIKISNIYWGAN